MNTHENKHLSWPSLLVPEFFLNGEVAVDVTAELLFFCSSGGLRVGSEVPKRKLIHNSLFLRTTPITSITLHFSLFFYHTKHISHPPENRSSLTFQQFRTKMASFRNILRTIPFSRNATFTSTFTRMNIPRTMAWAALAQSNIRAPWSTHSFSTGSGTAFRIGKLNV